jgi:tRNA(Ile)-lysidine synthase
LLQLLRGSGVAGLSGMETANTAPDLLGDPDLFMARPLLDVSRNELQQYAASHAIAYVDDESNADPRYARNALRRQAMPALAADFPGFQQRFARSAAHMQSAQRLLNELAAQDLAACLEGECLHIDRIRVLSGDRIDNLLRYWLGMQGARMPSASWLSEMRKQLLDAKDDAQLCVTHADGHIRRYRGQIYWTQKTESDLDSIVPFDFSWNGETEIAFSAFRGVLHFIEEEQGIDAEWLRMQPLQLKYRQGGERLKPAFNRPTRSLKHHYQSLNIPPWERAQLPLVVANGFLLYAAGIGMDSHHVTSGAGKKIRLHWERCTVHSR